jgi:acyl-CoA synthetase (NDP forming)
VIRLTGIDDFVRSLKGFLNMPLPRGGRLAFVTYSGAQAIMSIDASVDLGLQVARLEESTRERIGRVIATASKTRNPVDIFPDWLAHGFEKTTTEILKAFLEDRGVDGVICISFADSHPEIYQPMVEMLKGERAKPVFFSLLGAQKDIDVCKSFLEEHRIPCFDFPEMAVRVFAHMWKYAQIREKVQRG